MSQKIRPFNDRAAAFLNYEPIELNGLVYYPITVADYQKWQAVKPVLCLRQGTLPAVYACMTFLQCVWALDYNAKINDGGQASGPWDTLVCILALSLRLSDSDEIQAIGNPETPNELSHIRIIKDGQQHDISPMDFMQVRKLIADQNGAELPDEADNPELIEAASDIQNMNAARLNYSVADMLTSVASAKGLRRKDLYDWPVKEFEDESRALRRRYGYFLASIAESQGAKFKGGNPYPTWMFDKAKDEFAGLISMEQLQAEHHATIETKEDSAEIQEISKELRYDSVK